MGKNVLLEIRRQLIHATGCLFAPAMILFGYESVKTFLALSLVIMVVSALYRKTRSGKKMFIIGSFYKLENWAERQLYKYERKKEFLLGPILFGLGIYITSLIFPIEYTVPAILVLALGDSSSTLIGYTFGTHKLPWNRKLSFEGSFTFFVFAASVLYFFITPDKALAIGFVVALVESLPKLNDNLTIPLSTAFLLMIL